MPCPCSGILREKYICQATTCPSRFKNPEALDLSLKGYSSVSTSVWFVELLREVQALGRPFLQSVATGGSGAIEARLQDELKLASRYTHPCVFPSHVKEE